VPCIVNAASITLSAFLRLGDFLINVFDRFAASSSMPISIMRTA
jgi:hypothetical protein